MQAALVLLAVAGSTAWLAVDASKRDWTDNSFGRNVQSWVLGALLLWPLVFPMYVFVHRKKAPLKGAPAPKPEPAVAMAASEPAEQYGPSIDEVEDVQPEPAVEIEPEPVVVAEPEPMLTPEPDPVVEFEHEPVVEIEREPVVEIHPEPVVEVHPEPVSEPMVMPDLDPVIEFASEPVLTPEPDPVAELEAEPVAEVAPQTAVETIEVVESPEPMVESAEPVAEIETSEPAPEPEPKPVLDISHPDIPSEEAPPGLSVDAFKDIKPVSFGGAVLDDQPAPVAEPEPVVTPEPVAAPEPVLEAEPPVIEPPVVQPPALELDSEPAPVPAFEPLSYPLDDEPVIETELDFGPEPVTAMEETAAVEEPTVDEAKSKKRGLRLPKTSLKLPSFASDKLPQITLPENLRGPLSDLERKIVLGSVVAILAAGALGYSSAPSDDAAPAPAPAPAAASR